MSQNPLEGRSALALELRRLRMRAAMSQQDLAGLLGDTNNNSIVRWENGAYIPSEKALYKLAAALKCDMNPLRILRNAERARLKGAKLARNADVAGVKYLNEQFEGLHGEWLAYETWAKHRTSKLSFVAGWNAAYVSDVNFQFNG